MTPSLRDCLLIRVLEDALKMAQTSAGYLPTCVDKGNDEESHVRTEQHPHCTHWKVIAELIVP